MLVQDSFAEIKTKTLIQALERWGVDQEEYGLIILNENLPKVERSAANVEKLQINIADNLCVYDILRADKIVIEKSALEYIQEFYGASEKAAVPSRQKVQTESEKKKAASASNEKEAAKSKERAAKKDARIRNLAKQAPASKKSPAKTAKA